MATSTEFKHGLRLQLSDIEELLKYLKKEEPDMDSAVEKLEKMQKIILESLQD